MGNWFSAYVSIEFQETTAALGVFFRLSLSGVLFFLKQEGHAKSQIVSAFARSLV